MNKQEASLLLMNKVVVPNSKRITKISPEYVATFSANLMSLGFVLSNDVIEACVNNFIKEDFDRWANELKELLIRYNGSRENMKPMYPGFPKQVMEASELELFLNAIIHYASNGNWMPEYEETIKLRSESILTPKVIGLANDNELMSYVRKLAEMPVSMSQQQKEILAFLLDIYPEELFMGEAFNMPNKENMVFTIHCVAKSSYKVFETWKIILAEKNMHTITDVLRLSMAFLNGDISLSERKKLSSIKRSDRRFLLSLINKCYKDNVFQVVEDAARYQDLWKIVLEKLHPGEYKNRYIYTYQFAVKVREDKLRTWYSKLEKAYSENNVNLVVSMLKKRPGEFARRLERTIRLAINNAKDGQDSIDAITVVKEFGLVADKVDRTILLQLIAYFNDKVCNDSPINVRTFFPKGQVSKAYVIEENRTEISPFLYMMCKAACMQALSNLYKEREELGKIYIDPKITNFTVPLKLRNASKQLQTVSRGSRIKLPENTNILRLYTWWKNVDRESWQERVDIDLSAVFYNEELDNVLPNVYYSHLREEGCCHSGDIVTAPNGAAEFINIEIDTLLKRGVRYVAMSINSFSHTDFCDLPECFAGVMAIDKVEDREPTFDPAKSFIRSDISTASTTCIPMVFDLETKEVIWIDSVVPHSSYCNNVEYCKGPTGNLVRGILNASYPNLGDLILLNVFARNGEIVENKEDADLIFSLDEGITPFNLEIINSEWV